MASRFVGHPAYNGSGQDGSPQRTAAPSNDRAAIAQASKVGSKGSRAHSSSRPQTTPNVPNIPHLPAYPTGGNGQPDPRYQSMQQQQQIAPVQQTSLRPSVFDDDTIASDFDVTKTSMGTIEIPFSQQPDEHAQDESRYDNLDGYGNENAGDPDALTAHRDLDVPSVSPKLNHKQSQAQLKQAHQVGGGQSHSSPSGRFRGYQKASSHPSLELRPSKEEHVANPESKSSKKRGRSNEPLQDVTNAALQQQERADEKRHREADPRNNFQPVAPQGFQHGGQARQLDGDEESLETMNGAETDSQFESPARDRNIRDVGSSQQQQMPVIPDYTDEELKRMQYAELKTESWEKEPGLEPWNPPEELSAPDVTLEQKISYFVSRNQEEDARLFFDQMPTDEWHQAGDHMLSKMTGLMEQLRELRENKRKAIQVFEDYYETREKAIRGKSGRLDTKLKDMKTSGEDVLKGRI